MGGKLTRAEEERLWVLRRYASRPGWCGRLIPHAKKWDRAFEALVTRGWLEESDGLHRITDAGRAALGDDGNG